MVGKKKMQNSVIKTVLVVAIIFLTTVLSQKINEIDALENNFYNTEDFLNIYSKDPTLVKKMNFNNDSFVKVNKLERSMYKHKTDFDESDGLSEFFHTC